MRRMRSSFTPQILGIVEPSAEPDETIPRKFAIPPQMLVIEGYTIK